jgi:L-Ala-D/L-Glu epimerase
MLSTLITALAFEPLDLPLTEPFAIATGAQHVAHNVLVRLTLADGTQGLGEAAPFPAVSGETQAGTLVALESAREHLLGQDARAWRPRPSVPWRRRCSMPWRATTGCPCGCSSAGPARRWTST